MRGTMRGSRNERVLQLLDGKTATAQSIARWLDIPIDSVKNTLSSLYRARKIGYLGTVARDAPSGPKRTRLWTAL